jgi:hypothetical protein
MAKIILIWILTFLFKSVQKAHFLTVYGGGAMHENIIIRRLHYASRVAVPRPLRTPSAAPPTKHAFRAQILKKFISEMMRTNRFFISKEITGPALERLYLYMDYQSICPVFVGMGSPTPSPASECVSPLEPNGGEAKLPCGWEGGGTQFGRLERKSGTQHSILCGNSCGDERKMQYPNQFWMEVYQLATDTHDLVKYGCISAIIEGKRNPFLLVQEWSRFFQLTVIHKNVYVPETHIMYFIRRCWFLKCSEEIHYVPIGAGYVPVDDGWEEVLGRNVYITSQYFSPNANYWTALSENRTRAPPW